MKIIEKTYYNNNRETNPKDFVRSSIAPSFYIHKGGDFFYSILRGKKTKQTKKVLLKLDSKNVDDCLLEVEKKELFKSDNSEAPRRRLEDMKLGHQMALKLLRATESFTWRGFARLKLINSCLINNLIFEKDKIMYNPYWVNANNEKQIVIRLRDFARGKS